MFNKLKEKIKEWLSIFLKIEIVVRHIYEFPEEKKEVLDGKEVTVKSKIGAEVKQTFIGKRQDIKVQSNKKIELC